LIRPPIFRNRQINSIPLHVIVAIAPFHTAAKFMSKNWQWAAGTVLIPLLVWAATKTDAGSALLKQVIGGFLSK
jgi:hypothetical protein